MLTLKEKLEALARGNKLGSTSWGPNMYLYIEDDELCHTDISVHLSTIEAATHICTPQTLGKLGAEHVGKKAILRNGDLTLILSYEKKWERFETGGNRFYSSNGDHLGCPSQCEHDAVDIVD